MRAAVAVLALAALLLPAAAQDIRGLEACMAEKNMERRTGCLQANVELLQQMLAKLTRATTAKLAATDLELAAARAEIATLKSALAKFDGELKELKKTKAEPEKKK